MAPSPLAPESTLPVVNYPVYNQVPSASDKAPLAVLSEIFEVYGESKKHPIPEEKVTSLSEQKFKEAWAGESE